MKPPFPQLVELPAAPITGSPAPELTSLHAAKRRGPLVAGWHGSCLVFEAPFS